MRCTCCGNPEGPFERHHLVPGDDGTRLPTRRSCHVELTEMQRRFGVIKRSPKLEALSPDVRTLHALIISTTGLLARQAHASGAADLATFSEIQARQLLHLVAVFADLRPGTLDPRSSLLSARSMRAPSGKGPGPDSAPTVLQALGAAAGKLIRGTPEAELVQRLTCASLVGGTRVQRERCERLAKLVCAASDGLIVCARGGEAPDGLVEALRGIYAVAEELVKPYS